MPDFVHAPVEIPSWLMDNLNKFADLFNVSAAAADLGHDLLRRLTEQRCGTGFRSNLETAAYVVFGKSLKTFHSVRILCLHGCGSDALALCGSLFENLVDILYIRQDPERRAKSYVAFEQVDKCYQAQKVRRPDLPDEKRKTYEGYLAWLTPQVQEHLPMFPIQACWWELTPKGKLKEVRLRDRAEAVGFGAEYDTMYYILCSFKHTGPAAAAGFMFGHEEGVDVITGPNIKGIHPATLRSALYFLDLCGVFQDVYGLAVDVRDLIGKLTDTGDRMVRMYPHLCE